MSQYLLVKDDGTFALACPEVQDGQLQWNQIIDLTENGYLNGRIVGDSMGSIFVRMAKPAKIANSNSGFDVHLLEVDPVSKSVKRIPLADGFSPQYVADGNIFGYVESTDDTISSKTLNWKILDLCQPTETLLSCEQYFPDFRKRSRIFAIGEKVLIFNGFKLIVYSLACNSVIGQISLPHDIALQTQ